VDHEHDERQIWLSPDMACRLAAIDIGSNSVRLFVAEALRGGAYRILDEEREPTRLAHSVAAEGRLDEETMVGVPAFDGCRPRCRRTEFGREARLAILRVGCARRASDSPHRDSSW
jgi:hypothetical protein